MKAQRKPPEKPPMTLHALDRARERYGFDLTSEEIDEIVGKIERGEAVLMRKKKGGAEEYGLTVRGVRVAAVWAGGRLVTINPTRSKPVKMQKQKTWGRRPEPRLETDWD